MNMQSLNLHSKQVTPGIGRRELGACTIAELHSQRSQIRTVLSLLSLSWPFLCGCEPFGLASEYVCTLSAHYIPVIVVQRGISSCILQTMSAGLPMILINSKTHQLMKRPCREQQYRKALWSCQRRRRFIRPPSMPLQAFLRQECSLWRSALLSILLLLT